MKTDRELLELAAKAAVIPYKALPHSGSCWEKWDPLNDDGDALRLAVALCFNVFPSKVRCTVRGGTKKAKSDTRFSIVEYYDWDDDYYTRDMAKGTRRAITRAAAAIGEGVK